MPPRLPAEPSGLGLSQPARLATDLLPAACLVAALAVTPAPAPADDARELAVIATAQDSTIEGAIGPVRLGGVGGVVIRSPEELVARSDKPDAAKDPAAQKATAPKGIRRCGWNRRRARR